MHRGPMVQANSLMLGTCYWSASNAERGGDGCAEATLWVIPVCEAALAHRPGDPHVSWICWPIDLKS
jgi:hypothetical protein